MSEYNSEQEFQTDDLPELLVWLKEQLYQVELALKEPTFQSTLWEEFHNEPEKLVEGMIVLADGTDWDPGSGAGLYRYQGAAWTKIG